MTARIAILGGGLMGHGIAQVFASAGHDVLITDPMAEFANASSRASLQTSPNSVSTPRRCCAWASSKPCELAWPTPTW
jgi:3-hydroxyacyl-CoA dehydrogenase